MKKIDFKITLLLIALIYLIPTISHAYYYGSQGYSPTWYPGGHDSNMDRRKSFYNNSVTKTSGYDWEKYYTDKVTNFCSSKKYDVNKCTKYCKSLKGYDNKNKLCISNAAESKKKILEGKVNTFCSATGSVKKCQSYCLSLNKIDKGNKLCQGDPTAKITNSGKI
jgi:hypothetical protein